MGKIIWVFPVILIVLLITSLTNPNFLKVEAEPETFIVPDDYPTIQAALDNANSGDTIFVRNGTYHENLIVNKSVSLIGEDKNLVIIDGGLNGSVITVRADNVIIQNFTIRNSGNRIYDSGVLVNNSTNVNIIQNIIQGTSNSIRLNFSSHNIISGNKIFIASFGGIVIDSSTDNIVSNNNISGCQWGIYIYASNNNFVSNNFVSENFYGIYLYSSGNNTVSGNNVSFNYQVGIHITFYSGDNIFYHNNLNNVNATNVRSNMMNIWDFRGEGNYWSDYTGDDLNKDGIGDIPHVLDKDNQDNYPLMGSFSVFDISVENEEYSIMVISNSTISNFQFEESYDIGQSVMSFIATGLNNSWGFCRIKFPRKFYPYVVLVNELEVVPKEIDIQNETYTCLYFDYPHNSSVSIRFSELLNLYYALLDNYLELQMLFYNLNDTYNILLQNYSQLKMSSSYLNDTYYALILNYSSLSESFTKLQANLESLNSSLTEFLYLNQTFSDFVEDYTLLLENYTQLLQNFNVLNYSFQELSKADSEQKQKIQDLVYVLITTTAMFILAIIYLSKQSSEFKLRNLTGEDAK